MFEMLEDLTFTKDEWQQIMNYASSRHVTCFATVNWLGGIEMMEELGAPAYKIASWDLNYPDLMRRMFETGKPCFVDLGPVSIHDVLSIQTLADKVSNDKVAFLYDFHTPRYEEMHMRGIPYLSARVRTLTGWFLLSGQGVGSRCFKPWLGSEGFGKTRYFERQRHKSSPRFGHLWK